MWREPSVVVQKIRSEVVLVHLDTNQIFNLNSTAARLWDLLGDGPTRPDRLIDELMDEYDVDREQLAEDVARVLRFFHDHQLIRISGDH